MLTLEARSPALDHAIGLAREIARELGEPDLEADEFAALADRLATLAPTWCAALAQRIAVGALEPDAAERLVPWGEIVERLHAARAVDLHRTADRLPRLDVDSARERLAGYVVDVLSRYRDTADRQYQLRRYVQSTEDLDLRRAIARVYLRRCTCT